MKLHKQMLLESHHTKPKITLNIHTQNLKFTFKHDDLTADLTLQHYIMLKIHNH